METIVVDSKEGDVQQSEDPLIRQQDPTVLLCTARCETCAIAVLLRQLDTAERLKTASHVHRANNVRNTAQHSFLSVVTVDTMHGGRPEARMRSVAVAQEHFAGCHYPNVEAHREKVLHLLTVAAPKKIKGHSLDAQA